MTPEAARIARRAAQGARQTREEMEAADRALRQRQALQRQRRAARYKKEKHSAMLRTGRVRGPNLATNPILHAMISMVGASGMSDAYILKHAGLSGVQLSAWRKGAKGASVSSVSRVLNVIGATCRIEDHNAVTVLPLSLNALRRAVGRVSD